MKSILFFILFGIIIQTNAQVTSEKRIELNLNEDYFYLDIHEFGKNGFILTAKSEKKEDGNYKWKFIHYKTDLEKNIELEINLPKKFYLTHTRKTDNKLYQIYRDKKNLKLVEIELPSLKYQVIDLEIHKKAYVTDFEILNNYVFILKERKNDTFLTSINLDNNKTFEYAIEIPGFKPKRVNIKNLKIIKESNEAILTAAAYVDKKTTKRFMIRLNEKGSKKNIYDLSKSVKKILRTTDVSYINEDQYAITGTYAKNSVTLDEGIYFSVYTRGLLDHINYYKFSDLDKFFEYLPDNKQKKMEKKKERKKKKGKDLDVYFLFATHNIIKTDDGYLFLAEAYRPTYRTETITTMGANGRMITTTRTVFAGNEYTHAILVKFDLNGIKQWDQSFKMELGYLPFSVKRFINIAQDEQNSIKLTYASKDKIYSKRIDFSGKALSNYESDKIETTYEGDKTKKTDSDIIFWYDNYFLAHGEQTIINKNDEAQKRKRKVYFVNKLKFQ